MKLMPWVCRLDQRFRSRLRGLDAQTETMMARAEPLPARAFTYTAVFDPAPGGGYVVTFPALPGLVTEGETLEEARAMAADALRCYLEGHFEDALPIPVEEEASPQAVREAVRVELG